MVLKYQNPELGLKELNFAICSEEKNSKYGYNTTWFGSLFLLVMIKSFNRGGRVQESPAKALEP